MLADPDKFETLKSHLPIVTENEDGEPKSVEELKTQIRDTLISPQFQQALSMFSNALQSGQLGPVVSQFKLNEQAIEAANNGDMEQFIKALENTSIKSSENSPKPKEEEEGGDDATKN